MLSYLVICGPDYYTDIHTASPALAAAGYVDGGGAAAMTSFVFGNEDPTAAVPESLGAGAALPDPQAGLSIGLAALEVRE